MKVSNMKSDRTGRAIPNQYVIHTREASYFQSYDSIIVKSFYDLDSGFRKYQLDEKYWDYSKTTSKYRNQFMGMTTKSIKKAIDEGRVELVNLNTGEV